jgi:hypothetical protein
MLTHYCSDGQNKQDLYSLGQWEASEILAIKLEAFVDEN